MGLDTSHGCWDGSYGAFNRFRDALAEVAGFGSLDDYEGFGGTKPWPDAGEHPLVHLLHHSDCDGELGADVLSPLADAMEALLPALEVKGDGGGHVGPYAEKTQTFVEGLRFAAEAGEPVEFY